MEVQGFDPQLNWLPGITYQEAKAPETKALRDVRHKFLGVPWRTAYVTRGGLFLMVQLMLKTRSLPCSFVLWDWPVFRHMCSMMPRPRSAWRAMLCGGESRVDAKHHFLGLSLDGSWSRVFWPRRFCCNPTNACLHHVLSVATWSHWDIILL